jgi:hypothetical protein
MAASPIAWGNTVARPARATPCRDSFHQLLGWHIKAGNGGRIVHHLGDFLFESHTRQQIVGAFSHGNARVFPDLDLLRDTKRGNSSSITALSVLEEIRFT